MNKSAKVVLVSKVPNGSLLVTATDQPNSQILVALRRRQSANQPVACLLRFKIRRTRTEPSTSGPLLPSIVLQNYFRDQIGQY